MNKKENIIKTKKEIQIMREGGVLLAKALQAAVDASKPGVMMKEIDDIATKVIEDGGGTPSFKNYKAGGTLPFPATVCISRNDEVVHGVGQRKIVLEEGDIVGLDIGCWYKDLCTDMAVTVPIGNINKERLALLRATRDSMYAGVDAALVGNTFSDIGGAVEDALDLKKYSIVRRLGGHSVGHAVHENPYIPNYRSKKFDLYIIRPGMCLAIEPSVTTGKEDIVTLEDGWTIATEDGSDAGHFEVTIVTTEKGPEIITPLPDVKI